MPGKVEVFFYCEDLGGIWICPGERAECAPRTAEFHWAHFPLDREHCAVISFPYVVRSEPFLFYILKLSPVGKDAHFMSLKWTCWSTWCALKAVTFPNLCPLLNLEGKCSGLWALSTDFLVAISFVLPGRVMGRAVLGAALREQSHCQVKPGPTPHPLLRAAFGWGSARSLAQADRVHSHLSVTHTRLKLLLVIEEPPLLLSDFSTWPHFCRAAEVFHGTDLFSSFRS